MMEVHKYALATVLHDFCRYKISRTTRPSPYLHSHDFYEFIIVSNGQSTHCVNNTSIKMKKGDTAFIRSKDIHRCIPNGSDFEFYNIAVEPNLVTILFSFLGEDFDPKPYLEKTLPPTITLLSMLTPTGDSRLKTEWAVGGSLAYGNQSTNIRMVKCRTTDLLSINFTSIHRTYRRRYRSRI